MEKTTEVKSYTIKQLPIELRPRERLIAAGAASLSDAELIAILLGSGRKGHSAVKLAEELLVKTAGLFSLSSLSYFELSNFDGIGKAKAVQIMAAIELGKRLAKTKANISFQASSPQAVAAYLMPQMSHLDREHFRVLLLNSKNQLIGEENSAKGSLNQTIVHPRELYKTAIKAGAAAVIVAHNHPSGSVEPSAEDIKVTKRLAEAGKIIGIELLDHIIIGHSAYLSFKEKSLLT